MRHVLSRTEIESPYLMDVIKALQSQSIDYDGPFLTSGNNVVFRVKNKIVLDWELMALHSTGRLNPAGLSALLERIPT